MPNPKGGEERAFELPLSPPLIDLLRERAGTRTKGWLFPSIRWGTHIVDVRDDELGDLHGHALRHAYASIALEAGVGWAELKFLLNHSIAGMGACGRVPAPRACASAGRCRRGRRQQCWSGLAYRTPQVPGRLQRRHG